MIEKFKTLIDKYHKCEITYEEYRKELLIILDEYEEMRKSENSGDPGGNNQESNKYSG